MAGKAYSKNIRRTIRGSFGRYLAIMAIVALGVGFFAGVKDTKASMLKTCDKYVTEHNMYDFRVVSTLGFTDKDAEALSNTEGAAEAEGSVTADFFSKDRSGNSIILRAHSITEKINKPELTEGRLPENPGECLADAHYFNDSDIGKLLKVTDENSSDTKEILKYKGYEIVGLATSPCYLMKEERGTGTIGDGSIDAFVYIPGKGFHTEYFTEIFVTSEKQGYVYSDEYDENISREKGNIRAAAEERAQKRYDSIVSDAKNKIRKAQKKVDDGRKTLEEEKSKAYAELDRNRSELDKNSSKLESGRKKLKTSKAELVKNRKQLREGITSAEKQLEAAKESGMATEEQIQAAEAQITSMKASLDKVNAGLAGISKRESELRTSEKRIKSGYSELKRGKAEAESRFAKAENELEAGEKKIAKAERDLKKIKKPEVYIQTRDDNIGYDSFDSNSDIVDSIAKVFPIFFFLKAALVCSTTMSRMIEEERSQIGALRALGYTRAQIMSKYLLYSGSAAMTGCIIGFLAGSKFFPYAIWTAYSMMFGFAPLEFYFSWQLAVISLAVSVICSAGTTFIACRGQLRNMPAEIMRPETPKAGKRILLERMTFIWKRMKFLHKVTARNIFRYKKRMAMMIVGIGGCTALVLAGFGINDSIAGVADHQYTQIEKYDMTVAFSSELTEKKLSGFEKKYNDDISNAAVFHQKTVNVKTSKAVKSCNMIVSGDNDIAKSVAFMEDDKKLSYPGRGEAMINNKLADMLGVKDGDRITVNYDDTKNAELTVSGIYKNYVSNYIYINDRTYEDIMKKTYEPEVMFLTLKDSSSVDRVSSDLNDDDDVASVVVNRDIRKRVDDMMMSLNYIIILVIGCAGALAFIVLFNLGNINITERVREIATIEVLGFYPRETGAYVFRENFILVLIGIAAGLPAGYALHKFIMSEIVVDAVSFNEVIEPQSYGYAAATVIMFSIIVDIVMRRKLKKINMAEALKSVE